MARRSIASASLALAVSLLASSPASADYPPQHIESRTVTLAPSEDATLRVRCRPGYRAVAGAVVGNDPLVAVYSSRRVRPDTWEFRAKNFNPGNGGVVSVEIRCVKFGPTIVPVTFAVESAVEEANARRDELERCRRGYAPLATGHSHYPPGGEPGDLPPDGAFVHTYDSAFVRGGFDIGERNVGQAPVEVEHSFLCIDRLVRTATRRIALTIRRLRREVEVPGQAGIDARLTCPRGSLATGQGFDTPDDQFLSVLTRGWTGPRIHRFQIFNPFDQPLEGEVQGLCLSQEVTRR